MNSVVLMSILVFVLINVLELAVAFCDSLVIFATFGLLSNDELAGVLVPCIV